MQKIEKLADLGKFSSQSLTWNKTRNRPKYFFLRRAVFTMGVCWKASTGQGLFPYGYQPHHGSCIKLIYHTTRFHEKQIWTWSKYLSWFRFSGVSPYTLFRSTTLGLLCVYGSLSFLCVPSNSVSDLKNWWVKCWAKKKKRAFVPTWLGRNLFRSNSLIGIQKSLK